MAKHNETGIKGEILAKNFLLKQGYKILETNWRWQHKEVDIIAVKEPLLIFIEVKTRSDVYFGYPEDSVNEQKVNFLKDAAEEYLYQNQQYQEIRFDIISIVLKNGELFDIKHFVDAFF